MKTAASLAVSDRDRPEPRSPRRGFAAAVAVLAALIAIVFTATTSLTLGLWLTDGAYAETNPVVDLGFFALGVVIIAGGLASQLRSPERNLAGFQQAVFGLVALGLAGLVGGRVEPAVGAAVLLLCVGGAGVLHPARASLLRGGAGHSNPLAALALVATIPAGTHAATMLALARDAGPSCFAGQCARGDRFAEAAALAIAIVAVTLLASARTPGWRISARSAGLAAAILGVASIALPEVPGSIGTAWGAVAVGWGVLVVAAVEWQRWRTDDAAANARG